METNIPTVYEPQQVEKKWYAFWEGEKLFHAEVEQAKKPYTIVIPPPNVTGALHMGHAFDETLQDILIRWRRMQGYNALWMPGTDHAGIATQIKVEEELAKEGLNRYDLGRDKFIDRVWDWKRQYGSRILNQLKTLGSSCDWERERFTMDEGCSRAVREGFASLYEQGLIYRGNYMISWCPRCRTALSDIEVEHEDSAGHLFHIKYPLENSDEFLIVATTRPETMLGDVAVAVHPADERYRKLLEKQLILPLVGRRIPVIADEYVDPAFGTGAVKITPAHDPNDFEMGRRHGLDQVTVISADGTMGPEAGLYAGMDRYQCREKLVADLKEQGYLVKVDEHAHAVGHCQRCHTVVEPLVSRQWFVKMAPLAQPAIEKVKNGEIRFIPERFTKIYLNWVENVRDWCISRQIWWGHRIPAWYCACGEVIVSRDDVSVCPKCGGQVERDPDVLDTWFSSALWPFSTLGWPERTPELNHFFPTATLVTGYDIIYFWVARMIFMSLQFTGEVPFRDVYIHGLVRDAQGRKMSKSLGNGIDPVQVIEKYGADALRFTIVTGNTPGNDMRFYWERVESSRNFANKIWNASRFVLMNLHDFTPGAHQPVYTLADRWIISRFNRTTAEVTRYLENYELGEAARALYEFIWNEFCDWYIEMAKSRLYSKEDAAARHTAQETLSTVLKGTLELLHPFMPFLTEEIWQHLPHEGNSIMAAHWPQADSERLDTQTEQEMEVLTEVIKTIRNMRAEMEVPIGKKTEAVLQVANNELLALLNGNAGYLHQLAGVLPLTIQMVAEPKPEQAATAVAGGVEIYLPLKGLIDIDKEVARLEKELANLDKEVARLAGKLNNPGFLAKAPAEVVATEREKQRNYEEKRQVVRQRLAFIRTLEK
ncbi:MAG TPA: valine--tRNA ligase [Firmicutes bacterium]|nr:valine--tRNA ligase [Bacillota bacterium]